MADADKDLLLSLRKKRIPIDPLPAGVVPIVPTNPNRYSQSPRGSQRGATLANDVESGYMRVPTLHQHLGRIPRSEVERREMVETLLSDRERTFAETRHAFDDKRRKLHEKRKQLITQQKQLTGSTLRASLAADQTTADTIKWEHEVVSSPQNSREFIENLRQNLNNIETRLKKLREAHDLRREQLTKPYNGEFGPQSYEPWQMEDYFMIRGLVEEMVDQIINKRIHLYPPLTGDAAAKARRKELERSAKQLQLQMAEGRLLQLIMEELVLQESYNLTELTAHELYSLWQMIRSKSDKEFMKLAEAIATGQQDGRDPDDPAYDLVTKAFFSIQQHRDKYRPGVWAHSQPTNMQGGSSSNDEASDVYLLEFDHITPMAFRRKEPLPEEPFAVRYAVENWANYIKCEGTLWKGMKVQYTSIGLSKKCRGVTLLKVSPNNRMLAIGTAHGDILIYDVTTIPWQPLRTLHNQKRNTDDPILDIGWSMTGSHLATINLSGLLQLWLVHGHRVRSKNDNSRLELNAEQRGGWPEQLVQLILLDGERSDFLIQRGPLAGAEVHDRKVKLLPDVASFCPTFTIIGSQTSLAVAVTNGDILRLDLEIPLREHTEMVSPADPDEERPITDQSERAGSNVNNNARTNVSSTRPTTRQSLASSLERVPVVQNTKERLATFRDMIGQGIPVGLFRQHTCPVIYVGFIDNIGDMVTVDEKGYIFAWPFTKESLTTYGWYKPRRKLRISGGRITYKASAQGEEDVIFSNKDKSLTRKQKGAERLRVEGLLTNLNLKDPWHTEHNKVSGVITSVHLPKEGVSPESGAMFHVVERHSTSKYLYSYLLRLYEPYQVKSTKLVGVKQTVNGSGLIIVLLFPAYPPKVPSITVMVLDLHTLVLDDFLCNIDLTDEQYNMCQRTDVVSFDVSQPLGVSGASYMFMNYCGVLVCISLVTGNVVMKMKNPKVPEPEYLGLHLAPKELKELNIVSGMEVCAISTLGKLYAVLYHTGEDRKYNTPIQILELTDANITETRKNMREASLKLLKNKATYPREQRIDKTGYNLTSDDHSACWMTELVLECMDRAIEDSEGREFTQEQYQAFDESDKVFMYRFITRMKNLEGGT